MDKTQYCVIERNNLDGILEILEKNKLTNNVHYAKSKEVQSKLISLNINTLINVTTDNAINIYTEIKDIMEDGKFTIGDWADAYRLGKELFEVYGKYSDLKGEFKDLTFFEAEIWLVNLLEITNKILQLQKK